MIVTPRKINVAEDPKQRDFHITIQNESPVDDTNCILLFRIRRAQEKVLSFKPKKGFVLPGEAKDVALTMLTTNFHHSKLLVKAVIVPRNQVVQDFEASWNIGAAIGESKKLILLLGGLYDGLDERFMYGGSLNSGDSLISPSLLSINRSMSFSRDFSDISSVVGGGGGGSLPVLDRVASPLRGAIMTLNIADDDEENASKRYNDIIKQSTLKHTPRSMLLDRSFESFSRLIPIPSHHTSSNKPPMLSLHIDGTSDSTSTSRQLNEESMLLALEGRLTQALLAVGGAKVGNIEVKSVDLSGPLAVYNTLGKAFARPEGMQHGSSTKDLLNSNSGNIATELINSQLRALFLEDNLHSLTLTHCNLPLLTNDNTTLGINRFHSLTSLDLSDNRIAVVKQLDLAKLQSLNLSNNELTTLESLVGLTSLKTLIVRNNRLKGLRLAIGVLVPLKMVKVLDLSGNPVTEDGRYYEEVLLTFPHLTHLDNVDLTQLTTNSPYSTASPDKEEGRKVGRIRRVLLSKAYIAFKSAHGSSSSSSHAVRDVEDDEEGSTVSTTHRPKQQQQVKTITKQSSGASSRYSQQQLDMTDNSNYLNNSMSSSIPPSPSAAAAMAAINRAASFEQRHHSQPPTPQPQPQAVHRKQQEAQRPPSAAKAKKKPVTAAAVASGPALHERLHGTHTNSSRMVRRSFAVHRTHMEEDDYNPPSATNTAAAAAAAAAANKPPPPAAVTTSRLLEPTTAQKIRRRSFGIASPHDLEDHLLHSQSQVFDFQQVLDATNTAEEAAKGQSNKAVHKGPRYSNEQIKLMQQEPRYGIYHPRYRQPQPHFGYSKPFIQRSSVDDLGNITAAAALKNSQQQQAANNVRAAYSRSVSPTNTVTISPYLQSIPGFNKVVERIRDGFEKLPVRGTFTRAAKGLPAEWYPMDIQDLEAIRRQGYFHETIGDAAMNGQETRDLALQQTLLNNTITAPNSPGNNANNLSAFSTASLSLGRAVEEVRGSGSVVLSPNKRGRRGSLGSHLSRQYRDQSISPAAHLNATDRSHSPAGSVGGSKIAAAVAGGGKHRGKGNPITRTVWAQPIDTEEFYEVKDQQQQGGGESGFSTVESMHFLHSPQRRRSSMSGSKMPHRQQPQYTADEEEYGGDEGGSNSSYGGDVYPYSEQYEENEVYMQPPPPPHTTTQQRQPIKPVPSTSPSSKLYSIFGSVDEQQQQEEEEEEQRPVGLSVSLQRSFRELSSSFDQQPDFSAFFTSSPRQQQAAAAKGGRGGGYTAAYQNSKSSSSVYGSNAGEEESKARTMPIPSQIITSRELKPEASMIANSQSSDFAISPAVATHTTLPRGYGQDDNRVAVSTSKEVSQAEQKGAGVVATAVGGGGGEGALSSYLAWLTQQQQQLK